MSSLFHFFQQSFGFLGIFMPKGIPMALAPIIVPIEIISYISRPISHAVRLFAVILAGHVTLKVFTGFVAELSTAGPLGIAVAVAPLLMAVGITALEPRVERGPVMAEPQRHVIPDVRILRDRPEPVAVLGRERLTDDDPSFEARGEIGPGSGTHEGLRALR